MSFSILTLVYLQQLMSPHVFFETPTVCDFEIEQRENSIFVRPAVVGYERDTGQYQITTETLTGSNRSVSMQSGRFVIESDNVAQPVALLRLFNGASAQIHIEMKIFTDGQISKCGISYP